MIDEDMFLFVVFTVFCIGYVVGLAFGGVLY